MALVTLTAPYSSIKGSVGGSTFHRNRAGIVLCNKPIQSKSKTSFQSEFQNLFIGGLRIWQNLTFTQKQLWNDYADTYPHTDKWGQQKLLTGLNYFATLNFLNYYHSQYILVEPPTRILPDAVGPYTIILTPENFLIEFDPAFNPAGNSIAVFCTLPNTRITTSVRGKFKLIATFSETPFTTIDLTSAFNLRMRNDWNNFTGNGNFNIQVLVQTWRTSSGVYSVGLIKNANFDSENPVTLGEEYYYSS